MNIVVFTIGLIAHAFLLTMMLASKNNQKFQFWPPPNKNTWQYHSLWWSVRVLVICTAWLIYTTHSTVDLPPWLRYYIAMPLFIITFTLGSVAALQLGWKNTHGEAINFVATGFYKFSRNPQYVLFSISFICLGIWAASTMAFVLLLGLTLWYLRAPFPEEQWLEQKYGESYINYKNQVPRYF